MPETMPVVRKRTGVKSPGILETLPATMMMAMASPMARPTPSTTAVATPLRAAGRTTRKLVSISVAPSASEASSYSCGTARSAVSDTLMMDGRIITASTRIAASRHAPELRSKVRWMAGTSTIMPTRP